MTGRARVSEFLWFPLSFLCLLMVCVGLLTGSSVCVLVEDLARKSFTAGVPCSVALQCSGVTEIWNAYLTEFLVFVN